MQTTTAENILNVTLLEPRQKHPTIFVRFDELNEGESLTIHNDHDPKPLYYQLLGERGNIFIWEYQEQGPECISLFYRPRLPAAPRRRADDLAPGLHRRVARRAAGRPA